MNDIDIFDYDYEMTPAEHEEYVRGRFTELQEEILETVAHLSSLYSMYDDYQSLIAEIDIYGAEDLFGRPPVNPKLKARTGNGKYVF